MNDLMNITTGDSVKCLQQRRNARLTIGNSYEVVKVEKGYSSDSKKFLIKTDTGASHWVNIRKGRISEDFGLICKDESRKKIAQLSFADLVAAESILVSCLDMEDAETRQEAFERLTPVQDEITNRLDYIFN